MRVQTGGHRGLRLGSGPRSQPLGELPDPLVLLLDFPPQALDLAVLVRVLAPEPGAFLVGLLELLTHLLQPPSQPFLLVSGQVLGQLLLVPHQAKVPLQPEASFLHLLFLALVTLRRLELNFELLLQELDTLVLLSADLLDPVLVAGTLLVRLSQVLTERPDLLVLRQDLLLQLQHALPVPALGVGLLPVLAFNLALERDRHTQRERERDESWSCNWGSGEEPRSVSFVAAFGR